MYMRMADPNTPEGKALLVAESPLTQAKAIVTPLLVVQGKNDPRVNVRESDQIVAAVRDNGKAVEYLVAPDEGHGFARPINNLALVAAMEKFYASHLGGRYQSEGPSDVAAKLQEITVDPRTVSGAVTLKGAAPSPASQ
jgi:dipeptidyl aminopeptidase/acylaminoacyl peptidase